MFVTGVTRRTRKGEAVSDLLLKWHEPFPESALQLYPKEGNRQN